MHGRWMHVHLRGRQNTVRYRIGNQCEVAHLQICDNGIGIVTT